MQKLYSLHQGPASCGRTLWNNLVVGHMTSTIDSEDYKRLTAPEQMQGTCEFQYKDVAKVTVIATNNVRIEADTDEKLRVAESALKSLCEGKGCPLVDLN